MGTRRDEIYVRGPEESKGKVHGHYSDHNPIETSCGRVAYNVNSQGHLVEPPLLLISRDWNMITCRQCVSVLKIPPSYQLWNAVARYAAKQNRPKHLPYAGVR